MKPSKFPHKKLAKIIKEVMGNRPPETFRAGGFDWTVTTVESHEAMKPTYEGWSNHADNTITLRQLENSASMRRTMLHELIHVADMQARIGLEERQVEQL